MGVSTAAGGVRVEAFTLSVVEGCNEDDAFESESSSLLNFRLVVLKAVGMVIGIAYACDVGRRPRNLAAEGHNQQRLRRDNKRALPTVCC